MTDRDRLTTTATLERMVQLVAPDWSILADDPEPSGRHATHRLHVETPSGDRRVVLKASNDEEPFCREARLLAVLDSNTTLPVPTVLGVVDEHDDLPAPFFLMEEVPGESVDKSETDTLSEETLRQIAVSSGRHLAELHALDAVDAFGVVDIQQGEPLSGGRPAGDPGTLRVPDGDTSWATHVESSFEELLDALEDSRFDDVCPDVAEAVEPMVAELRATEPFDPVIGRVEHSLDNVLFDREAGTITGLLDWEFVASMTAANDMVFAEFWLSGGQWGLLPNTPDYRRLVRDGLLEGYREVGSPAVLTEFRAHYDCYATLQLLRTMVLFDGLFDAYGATDREREGAAATLRDRLLATLEPEPR
ncbi:phosphotransferase family protein [Haloarchaeobius amylolyticus]|uniref:phosphotransferase family protein n=1 Tax=Haloarchaeobius amylolyticus TaxID=1198296 RepID=UPI002271D261|nr:phosphotransferase [Haloarchaeobius amylolyticus]